MTKPVIITLDGPSGSGKGTISQLVAKYFDYHLLDSGSLYRLTAFAALKRGIPLDDEVAVGDLSHLLDVDFKIEEQGLAIYLDGEAVTDSIRQEDVGIAASKIAKFSSVREGLLDYQRSFARLPGLVADGRDMGTTVFPEAQFKFYLTASADARADRRCAQLAQKGFDFDWNQVVADIKERDERDTNRALSPLRPADDAILIDSTNLSIEAVFNRVVTAIESK
ncbi:MAG: (d)CMP kinase [Cellvibrio sp.]